MEVLADTGFPRVDLVHTSPPYNIDKPYAEFTDQQHLSAYRAFIAQVAQALARRIRVGGSLFWQTGYTRVDEKTDGINPIDVLTHPVFGACGFYLKDRIIWRYYGGMSFKSKFKNQHETIYWYVRGDPQKAESQPIFHVDEVRERSREHDPRNNLFGRNPGNVWEVDRVAFGSAEQTSHIAVFPEEISERIIRACSRPGDLVLDPFLGSGTVAKVARSLGRRYIGIEISRHYHHEATQRLGYQQVGEADTVASEWVKQFLMSRAGGCKRKDVAEFLEQALTMSPSAEEQRFSRIASGISSAGRGVAKANKPNLWRATDAFVESLGERVLLDHGPVSNAVRAYLRNYRLAKCFNGIRLLHIASKIVDTLKQEWRTASGLESALDRILANEPSSYEVKGTGLIVLREVRRRVKAAPTSLSKSTEEEKLLFAET